MEHYRKPGFSPSDFFVTDFKVGPYRCLVKQTRAGALFGIIVTLDGNQPVHSTPFPEHWTVIDAAEELRERALRLANAN